MMVFRSKNDSEDDLRKDVMLILELRFLFDNILLVKYRIVVVMKKRKNQIVIVKILLLKSILMWKS